MLIRPVNNKENINFRAKVKIKYVENCYDKLSKDYVNSIEKYAKQIGTEKDIIEIILGKCKSNTESWSEMGHRYAATTKSRAITAKSNINSHLKEEYIGYSIGIGKTHGEASEDKIDEYLKKLNYELKQSKHKK